MARMKAHTASFSKTRSSHRKNGVVVVLLLLLLLLLSMLLLLAVSAAVERVPATVIPTGPAGAEAAGAGAAVEVVVAEVAEGPARGG